MSKQQYQDYKSYFTRTDEQFERLRLSYEKQRARSARRVRIGTRLERDDTATIAALEGLGVLRREVKKYKYSIKTVTWLSDGMVLEVRDYGEEEHVWMRLLPANRGWQQRFRP